MDYLNCAKAVQSALSESQQMYLVVMARRQGEDEPVPLSQLADALSISPVSVNEMCRKLQDQGLVVYRPYKGVSLTPEGERHAQYVLRRHRLWEVFLVQELGFDYDQAHDAACELEHTTSDLVAERLDSFLGHPRVNPTGEPIPRAGGGLPERFLRPLTTVSAGQRAQVIRYEVDEAAQAFLRERGLRPGARLQVAAVTKDSLLVRVNEAYVSLGQSLAEGVQVEARGEEAEPGKDAGTSESVLEGQNEKLDQPKT